MKRLDKCRCCGRPEDEHCDFEPFYVPYTCRCNPEDWLVDDIPEVCKKFLVGDYVDGLCFTCDHLEECHK